MVEGTLGVVEACRDAIHRRAAIPVRIYLAGGGDQESFLRHVGRARAELDHAQSGYISGEDHAFGRDVRHPRSEAREEIEVIAVEPRAGPGQLFEQHDGAYRAIRCIETGKFRRVQQAADAAEDAHVAFRHA